MRPGLLYTLASLLLAGATAVVVRTTATEATRVVTQLLALALLVFVIALVVGSSRGVSVASLPILATIMVQAEFGDDPTWIRSLVIGCLWFVTLEMAWEALDRRDGSRPTPAALFARLQDVTVVVGLSLVVGLVATLAISLAPLRTVLLQAVVLSLVLGTFVMLLRRVTPG